MKITHVHTDEAGASTLILTVQDNSVGLTFYFHDEDLILTEPEAFAVLDPAEAIQIAHALLESAALARDGIIEGWAAERRRRVGEE